jgi:outer membrane protein OmpA-like peptidoglycan-associated protein
MTFKSPLLLATVSLLALSACVQSTGTDSVFGGPRTTTGVTTGALLGAAVGATSSGNRLENAAGGAILGGILGGTVGTILDQQAADLQRSVSQQTQIVNNGDSLTVTMPQDILFATNSATLRPDLQRDIYAVATNLINYPDSTVEVVGHTDNTGPAAFNQDLSQRRAAAVADILRGAGVPGRRVIAYGRGPDLPIATNATAEGRTLNRRVEIVIRPSN